jgi:hypothetical protein
MAHGIAWPRRLGRILKSHTPNIVRGTIAYRKRFTEWEKTEQEKFR